MKLGVVISHIRSSTTLLDKKSVEDVQSSEGTYSISAGQALLIESTLPESW